MINLVNWQQEEPTDCGGERQLSVDGTSRVSREAQAGICERLGVRFPGATRPAISIHVFSARRKVHEIEHATLRGEIRTFLDSIIFLPPVNIIDGTRRING